MSETLAVVRASRPNFLLLAPLCAGLGLAVAWQQGESPALLHTLLVFVSAVLAHAAVNLLNEYDDFRSGLDMITHRTPFSGGSGALPETPSAARRVLLAGLGTLALVVVIGLYFLWLRGLPLLVLGAAGVVLVLTYTRWITRSPLLCLLAPGIGFGPIMVLGSVIAVGARIDTTALLTSLVALLMVSELLLINQIPDAKADREIGRAPPGNYPGPGKGCSPGGGYASGKLRHHRHWCSFGQSPHGFSGRTGPNARCSLDQHAPQTRTQYPRTPQCCTWGQCRNPAFHARSVNSRYQPSMTIIASSRTRHQCLQLIEL